MTQSTDQETSFKDYCLILQVHPEADAGMIEAAYWHLARRYNEQADTDPLAKEKLDELNEAYNVLGTPARHEEYARLRDEVLGHGTLPKAAVPPPEPAPLAVMDKQRLRSRVAEPLPSRRKFDLRFEHFVEPSWHNTLVVLIGLSLSIALLAVSASQVLIFVILTTAMLFSGAPIIHLLSESRAVRTLLDEPERNTHLRHIGSKRPR